MIHLKAMIEIARASREDVSEFFDLVEQVRPFVFTSDPEKPGVYECEIEGEELDLPFPVCSFEDVHWRMNITQELMDALASKEDHAESDGTAKEGFTFKDTKFPPIRISCFVVRELAPREYDFWLYDSYDDFVVQITDTSPYYDGVMAIVRTQFLNRIKKSEVGVAKVKETIKIGSKRDKKQLVIKKIIYVSNKENKKYVVRGDVSWKLSHRTEVMGYWRPLPKNSKTGIGKNRDGDYCIKGETWVRHHEKGPEDAPLIKKTRVMITEE